MPANKQIEQNTKAIEEIRTDIRIIKDNHLSHIEKDMNSMDSRLEKMDKRLWWLVGLLIASGVLGAMGG